MPGDAQYRPSPAHSWLRGNVLGLVAIFIALNGTAVAVQTASKGDSRTLATEKAAKKKAKRGPAGPQGPAGPAGLQGPQGPTGLGGPPSGTAGGELAGTYPDPTVGTVAGLDVASSTSPSGGINFGADANLYRDAANGIKTDDELEVDGIFRADGGATLGNSSGGNVSISGITSIADATTAGGALRIGSIDTGLYRSAADTLRTDDTFDVGGILMASGNTTLGSNAADTVTVNSGPINFPNATSDADGLVLGGDAELHRSAADTLRTDDTFSAEDASVTDDLSVTDDATASQLNMPILGAVPSAPLGTGAIWVECTAADTIALRFKAGGGAAVTVMTAFALVDC